MNLRNIFSSNNNDIIQPPSIKEERGYLTGALMFNNSSSYLSSQNMRLSAVYCAVNLISNSVATLPINIYNVDTQGFKNTNIKHELNNILNRQPSQLLNKFNFFKLIIASVLLKGNGYAVIVRDANGKVKALKYIHPERVTVSYNEITDEKIYYVVGLKKPVQNKDMLHFWYYSNDLVNGLSVINYAVNSLKLATDCENHSQNFFKSGAATSGLLLSKSKLNEEQKGQIRTSWNQAFANPDSVGVAIVPDGFEYQPISINAKDAQLLESREFNVVEIARFFNVSPVKLYDLNKVSYSTLEQANIEFYEQTIKPYLQMIEDELNNKLISITDSSTAKISFDYTSMLNTDKKTLAEYYKTLLVNGVLTINEVRKALNYNDVDAGDNLFMQLNMSTVDNLINNTPAAVNDVIQQKTNNNNTANK